jgi:hypothetical protein
MDINGGFDASFCVFLLHPPFHMFSRTAILNHKAGEFSISYETLKEKANKSDVTEQRRPSS